MASHKFVVVCTVIFALVAWYALDNFNPLVVKGRNVLITGGSSGIGEHLAYEYCKYGAKVLIAARRQKELERVVSKCKDLGAKQAHYIVADLSTLEEATALRDKTYQLVGDLDVLVLNHVMGFSERWTAQSDLSKVSKYFEVNTFSYINLATLFLPQIQRSSGSIVVVSSVAGLMGIARQSCYSANKHALHGFFNSLRQDLVVAGYNSLSITLCIIGPIDTPGITHFENYEKMYWYPVDKCAWAIFKGATMRLRQIYYPYMLTRFTEIMNYLFPEMFETLAQVYAYDIPLHDGVRRYFRLT